MNEKPNCYIPMGSWGWIEGLEMQMQSCVSGVKAFRREVIHHNTSTRLEDLYMIDSGSSARSVSIRSYIPLVRDKAPYMH